MKGKVTGYFWNVKDFEQAVNGDRGPAHEALAKFITTEAGDDSLAIKHSLLQDIGLRDVMEKRWWPYILWWFPMILLSLWVAVKVLFYRALKRPKDKERMLLGPEKATRWFDMAGPLGYMVRNGVTTSGALDAIYSVLVVLRQPKTCGEHLIRFWLDQPDGQAVRNRLRITYCRLLGELEGLYAKGQRKIDFLALACGSAQASIEAVAKFRSRHSDMQVRLCLVDLSASSLRRARRLAEARGIADCVLIGKEGNIKEFMPTQRDDSWDIVEMVGFLDYRSLKSAIWICGQIRRILRPGCVFVGAHIAPSPWSFVVRWVINWPLLIRRTPEKFKQILLQSGFKTEEVEMVIEPNRIHPVCVCRKS